jgi:hypothetical protein
VHDLWGCDPGGDVVNGFAIERAGHEPGAFGEGIGLGTSVDRELDLDVVALPLEPGVDRSELEQFGCERGGDDGRVGGGFSPDLDDDQVGGDRATLALTSTPSRH